MQFSSSINYIRYVIATPPPHQIPLLALTHIKLFSSVLIAFLIKKGWDKVHLHSVLNNKSIGYSFLKSILSSSCRSKWSIPFIAVRCLILLMHIVNLILIVISNPSLLNPGPNSLSILYQNVQGLIPFSQLGLNHPSLDMNKILEFQAYLAENSFDVVALNETWLKPSILDNEILDPDQYHIYRVDRSIKSHPPDPVNTKKFRRNGGGVLIAIKSDLEVVSTKLRIKCGSEILAIQLTMGNGKKVVICTCYRVGTLGIPNHDTIIGGLRSFLCKKKLERAIIIGDFNLSEASWSTLSSPMPIEQMFINSFCQIGLKQCISLPTHTKSNILLTNSEGSINNLKIHDKDVVCKSAHYPITFNFKTNVKRKKSIKREFYKFSHANWDSLNNELLHTNWDNVFANCDVESAWNEFKSHLFTAVDKFIPKCRVRSDFQPPWFDSEAYAACRKKERLRAKFKRTQRHTDELKFIDARRDFKRLVKQKMRDNLAVNDEVGSITKKFWSHVKSTSNSHRIPECVNYKDTLRRDPQDQAELFNSFFADQFSETSLYDIDIDFSSDDRFCIDFYHSRVRKILSDINSNKAQGPDRINGKNPEELRI